MRTIKITPRRLFDLLVDVIGCGVCAAKPSVKWESDTFPYVASVLEIDEKHVWSIVKRREQPSLEVANQIACRLGIPADSWFRNDPPPPEPGIAKAIAKLEALVDSPEFDQLPLHSRMAVINSLVRACDTHARVAGETGEGQ